MKDSLPVPKHLSTSRLAVVLAWLVSPGLALLLLTGCASNQTSLANPLPVTASAYSRVYQAAADVLEYQGYRLDRQDYRFGVITTYPRISPTVFEPWFGENSSVGVALESTTNYLRRRVSIRLVPDTGEHHAKTNTTQPDAPNVTADTAAATDTTAAVNTTETSGAEATKTSGASGGGGYLLEAEVLLEQVETPRRFLTGSSAQGRMFQDLREVPTELADRNIHDNYWRVIGRDRELEQRLMAAIVHKSDELAKEAKQATAKTEANAAAR